MDISTAVFNAARDGKLKLIQKLLKQQKSWGAGDAGGGEDAGRHAVADRVASRTPGGGGVPAGALQGRRGARRIRQLRRRDDRGRSAAVGRLRRGALICGEDAP